MLAHESHPMPETPAKTLRRTEIVQLFGTPDETVGSVNEPRQLRQSGSNNNSPS